MFTKKDILPILQINGRMGHHPAWPDDPLSRNEWTENIGLLEWHLSKVNFRIRWCWIARSSRAMTDLIISGNGWVLIAQSAWTIRDVVSIIAQSDETLIIMFTKKDTLPVLQLNVQMGHHPPWPDDPVSWTENISLLEWHLSKLHFRIRWCWIVRSSRTMTDLTVSGNGWVLIAQSPWTIRGVVSIIAQSKE